MAHRQAVRRAVLAVMVIGSLLASASPAAGYTVRRQADPLPGVQVRGLSGDGLSIDVGRISKGAPVRVEVVTAGAVHGAVETTSAVCRRVGGILCVNADFAACSSCNTAFGGIVHDNALWRSPVGNHQQLWLGPSGTGAGTMAWSTTIEATLTYLVHSPPVLGGLLPSPPPKERVEKVQLPLDAVNRSRGANQVVLYTPPWSETTRTGNGGEEAVLGGGAPVLGTVVPLTPRGWKGTVGSNPIPRDGMVLSAAGAGAARMRAFWTKANDPAAARRSLTLHTGVDKPAEESVGGHPVVLSNGREVISHSRDPFATNRHPRTLVGWNPAGDLMLVTVDGRQSHSSGVSLVEAADVLRKVGATSGFNLDGGGSTTFVSLAPGGTSPRVLNRPSDGNERRVTTVIAVVPNNPGAVRSAASAPPPPQPPPAPPGPPPPDEASTEGLAAVTGPPTEPTTTTTAAPPTTVAPTTTTLPPPPPPPPVTEPPEVFDEVAAPLPAAPDLPDDPSTLVPGTVAALALVGAAGATARTARRTRRQTSP